MHVAITRMTATAITAAAAIVTLAACGTSTDEASSPAVGHSAAPNASAVAQIADNDPCGFDNKPAGYYKAGTCIPVAVADIASDDAPAVVGIVDSAGFHSLTVTTDDPATSFNTMIDPSGADLSTTYSAREMAEKAAVYNLDVRPGAEIVIPIGMRGSNTIFQVFGVRDGELTELSAPGSAMQLNLGMTNWVFPGDGVLVRVVCRESGIGLGSTEMPTPQVGRMTNFVSKLGPKVGEAGEWVVSEPEHRVDPSIITDMSIGQTHFKCEDRRSKSLISSSILGDPSAAPATTTAPADTSDSDAGLFGCSPDEESMTTAVEKAIGGLPTVNGWAWQRDGSPIPDKCATLDFTTTTVEGATNSSPVAVLLFHDGEFVGTASECHPPVSDVQRSGGDAVVVTYRYPNEGDPNAGMTGRATRTYRWADGKVVKSGDVPERLTQLAGCTP